MLIHGRELYQFCKAHIDNANLPNPFLYEQTELDVHLGPWIWTEKYEPACLRIHDLKKGMHEGLFDKRPIPEHGAILKSKEFALFETEEYFRMPNSAYGVLTLRSWAARSGLEQSTSQVLKPGFEGHLVLEFVNELKHHEMLIHKMDPVAQIQFFWLED